MIRYKVIKNGVETNSWLSTFADEKYYEPSFGKPERWVTAEQEDVTGALETRVVDVDGVQVTEYKMPAQYTIQIEDITAETAAKQARELAREQAQARIDAIDVRARLATATTVAALRSIMQDILLDLVELRKR